MKKLLLLFMILGMVSVANAGMVDIVISSLNGQPIEPTSEITIAPTDIINMDIVYTGDPGMYLFSMSFDVVADGPGTLDGTEPTYPDGIWDMALTEIILGTQTLGVSGAGSFYGLPGTGAPEIAVDHLLMHCDDAGDVLVYLVENPDLPAGGTLEVDENFNPGDIIFGPGVIVHQVPEPMTLTLLGLGGLFLARRKK